MFVSSAGSNEMIDITTYRLILITIAVDKKRQKSGMLKNITTWFDQFIFEIFIKHA